MRIITWLLKWFFCIFGVIFLLLALLAIINGENSTPALAGIGLTLAFIYGMLKTIRIHFGWEKSKPRRSKGINSAWLGAPKDTNTAQDVYEADKVQQRRDQGLG